jgi:F-box-like
MKVDCSDNQAELRTIPYASIMMTRRQANMNRDFDPTMPSPFTTLPNEMLENIFNFLDRKSLKNALLVNSTWESIITSSQKVMKKLPLTINLSRGADNKEIYKSNRHYQVVEFRDIKKKIPKYLIETIKTIGMNVKSVNYKNCDFNRKGNLMEASKSFPKVENIEVESERFDTRPENIVKVEAQHFPNLKTLKVKRVSCVSFF